MTTSNSPETVVQRQLEAYNARDLEALLLIYAKDVQLYEFPSTLVSSGTSALREGSVLVSRNPIFLPNC